MIQQRDQVTAISRSIAQKFYLNLLQYFKRYIQSLLPDAVIIILRCQFSRGEFN
jgi:hypothetical protein